MRLTAIWMHAWREGLRAVAVRLAASRENSLNQFFRRSLAATRFVAHGVANSLLMPHVFRFNLPAMPERYADIAVALGVTPAATASATAEAGLVRLTELSRACGVPQRLRDVRIPEADLPRLAREASKIQRLLKNNPREVTEADALAIYRQAF